MKKLTILIILCAAFLSGCIQEHFVPQAPEPTTWSITVHFPDGDSGEYKFIVNGDWFKDPNNSNEANGNSKIDVPAGGTDHTFTFKSDDFDYAKVVKEAYIAGTFNAWNNYEFAFSKQ